MGGRKKNARRKEIGVRKKRRGGKKSGGRKKKGMEDLNWVTQDKEEFVDNLGGQETVIIKSTLEFSADAYYTVVTVHL